MNSEMQTRNFSFVIEGVLAGSARPGAGDDDLAALEARGVAGIVSLTSAPLDCDALALAGFEYRHLPVPDFGAPGVEAVRRFVEFVRRVSGRGRGAVVVHCSSGYGRTGTMLACFLVSEGRSADDAIAEVRRLRPGSVETSEQEAAVRAWERHVSPRRAAPDPSGRHGDAENGRTF